MHQITALASPRSYAVLGTAATSTAPSRGLVTRVTAIGSSGISTQRAYVVRKLKTAAIHLTAAGAAVGIMLSGSTAKAGGDLQLGSQVFSNNCAACHMGGGNTVLPDHTLKKAAIEQFLDGGLNITAIVYQVQNGKNAMPAWEDQLDEDEIQAVAEYVYDQSTNDKW